MERRVRDMIELNEDIRIEYSELLVGNDLVQVDAFLECKIEGAWKEIGHAMVTIDEDQRGARWGDIVIGSRNGKYVILDPERGRPKNIDSYVALRGRGIGSRVAGAVLDRLKLRGISRVYGEIATTDDKTKASRFWESLGFNMQNEEIEKFL